MNAIARTLASLVPPRVEPAAAQWLADALAACSRDREALLVAVAGAGRRLGRSPVELTPAERAGAREAGMEAPPEAWGVDECGRGALVLAGLTPRSPEQRKGLVADLFYRGEYRERQALLRVLAYLPEPEAHLEVAVEACRSSVQGVFEAIACENPYPARHFTETSFNQMVLKALFTGAAVARIAGLERRANADLVRMAEGYASERRAASRPVPPDIDRILALGRRQA
jgi:hypothetical protein